MNVKEKYTGLQSLLKILGTDGCHFLVLCSIIDEYNNDSINVYETAKTSIKKGWMDKECWVSNATAILTHFTGKEWSRSELVSSLPAKILDNQFTEVIYKNGKVKHYKRRGFDTLDYSKTVAEGDIYGYYIYTVKE